MRKEMEERIKEFLKNVNDTRGYSPEELDEAIGEAIDIFKDILKK